MKAILVVCLLSGSLTVFSQKKDYLIKNNGDTVWGEIKVKNKMFQVKNEDSYEIDPGDIQRVKIARYRGSVVLKCTLLLYTDNLDDLQIDYINKGAVDTILILDEIYASPKMNLYYTQSDFKIPFYFYKTPADSVPVQLVIRYFLQGGLNNYSNDRARYRGDKSKVVISEDKGYVNQLFAIMKDCKKIPESMWELLSYRDYSLKQLIRKYNTCN